MVGGAFASGTAYAGITTYDKYYNGSSSSSSKNSGSGNKNNGGGNNSSASEAANDFKEVFDWFEVKLEEINEQLELWGAQLENIVGLTEKSAKIDDIIAANKNKLSDLKKGEDLYNKYLNTLLNEIPDGVIKGINGVSMTYKEAAQNGAIDIEKFVGEAGEKTLEAINNYRDWSKKVADVKQQMEELVKTIEELAKQKFDNIDEHYDHQIDLIKNYIDRLKDSIDLIKEQGNIASESYYEVMIQHTQAQLAKLKKEHDDLQNSLDDSVRKGLIQKQSDAWYEMVEAIYDVDGAIADATKDLESFQNSINDIYWDNFNELIDRLGYVNNETENLIDLLQSSGESIDYPKDNEFWTAKEVKWTKKGIATLGLYAQKMENAEYTAEQYAIAINDLNKDYADGKYSMSEYQKKLDELKKAQYSSIQSYYDAQKAMVELKKSYVDVVKNGIQKEIDAYSKLIEKRKESLSQEKNMYDFQKQLNDKNKTVEEITRKIAALDGDYSQAAIVQRRKLDSELLQAMADVNETLYDRNIENQQNALDKELEDFRDTKEKEIEGWEKYLEDVERVVADSLNEIKDNATGIFKTLQDTAGEYNLKLSDAVTEPWKSGFDAVTKYQEKFNTASSQTYDQLEGIKNQWKDIIKLMQASANVDIKKQIEDNQSHIAANKDEAPVQSTNTIQAQVMTTPQLSKGSSVQVKTTATHFSSKSGNKKMASFVPGGRYTVYQTSGDQVLIGKNGVYTGWVRKQDLVGNYAKGTPNLKKSGVVNVDELGEELILGAQNGRLTYLEKGSGIVPADLTQRIMDLAQINPQDLLDRNRASIKVAPEISSTKIDLNINYGELIRIDEYNGGDLRELESMVAKQFEQHTKNLNNSLRRFVR